MRLSVVSKLSLQPIRATWYRAIPTEHWSFALRTEHTRFAQTRFNPGGANKSPFEILYLASNQIVALYETGAVIGSADQPVPNPVGPKISIVDASVRLQSVVDLTEHSNLRLLQTSLQELTGSWSVYPPGLAPTQKLGAALFATEIVEGFLTISSKMPRCKTLIVFPQKLRAKSEMTFEDSILKKTHRVAGN